MTLTDVKDFLAKEYNWVHAEVAVHPYLALAIGVVVGVLAGHYL